MVRKLAAVVGVGKGIGGAVARALAARGYDVGLFARNETYHGADKLSGLAAEIQSSGGRAFTVQMDASDPADVERGFASLVAQAGGKAVDVLVYNAGARELAPVPVDKQSADTLLKYWKTNAFGAFLCAKQVWTGMAANNGGTILFTGATASLRGKAGFASFGMGKAALRSLSQSLVEEGASHNIHVRRLCKAS